jgi:hypothetical protein
VNYTYIRDANIDFDQDKFDSAQSPLPAAAVC